MFTASGTRIVISGLLSWWTNIANKNFIKSSILFEQGVHFYFSEKWWYVFLASFSDPLLERIILPEKNISLNGGNNERGLLKMLLFE